MADTGDRPDFRPSHSGREGSGIPAGKQIGQFRCGFQVTASD
uniref:Uncharacterized protein n=1 Tax=Faecalibaculum rodentium TaxID=1702221 RepID=A0A140DTF6_9FIRM|nr:hypothetical protein AALO17_07990 [Faecalibaculum rodentium]